MRNHGKDLLTFAAVGAAAAILIWAGLATRPDPATLFRGSVSSLQDAAGFAAAAFGLVVALWWSLGMILAVVSAVLHKAGHAAAAAAAGALAPSFMKRLAAAAIGLNLVSGMGAAAAAESFAPASPPQSISALQRPGDAAVHPQWEPTAQLRAGTDPQQPADGLSAAAEADQSGEPPSAHWKPRTAPSAENVFIRPGRSDTPEQAVVQAGDSLWSLAAAQLGPLATDTQIAAHWPRWYELNRTIIGDHPDLILPGQILEVPEVPEVPRQ